MQKLTDLNEKALTKALGRLFLVVFTAVIFTILMILRLNLKAALNELTWESLFIGL